MRKEADKGKREQSDVKLIYYENRVKKQENSNLKLKDFQELGIP